jgi:hypothetical protein
MQWKNSIHSFDRENDWYLYSNRDGVRMATRLMLLLLLLLIWYYLP